jgi:hypothetical protein
MQFISIQLRLISFQHKFEQLPHKFCSQKIIISIRLENDHLP